MAETSGNKSSGKTGADRASSNAARKLREAGDKAAELAKNPVAQGMLAAGLVTAAAALSSNKKVRASARKAGRGADSAEDAFDQAVRIGSAMIGAAADAVRKILGGEARTANEADGAGSAGRADTGTATGRTSASAPRAKAPAKAKSATATKTAAAKPAVKKTAAKSGTQTAKPAAKKAASTRTKKAGASKAPAARGKKS